MNQLVKVMRELQLKNKKAFVPYIMAGDGGIKKLGERLHFLEKSGATAIEVGIPFSDPVADGPTIQQAGLRALEQGTTLRSVIKQLDSIKDTLQTPILLMTYLNPILAYGIENFVNDSKEAHITGCIIADLPVEEEGIISEKLEKANIELVRLVTLTTPLDRVQMIANRGNGFLYCVTVKGTTGVRQEFDQELLSFLASVKSVSHIPVLAGFGISDSVQAKNLAEYCDGVVVGSKIVDLFEKEDLHAIETLMTAFQAEDILT